MYFVFKAVIESNYLFLDHLWHNECKLMNSKNRSVYLKKNIYQFFFKNYTHQWWLQIIILSDSYKTQ